MPEMISKLKDNYRHVSRDTMYINILRKNASLFKI